MLRGCSLTRVSTTGVPAGTPFCSRITAAKKRVHLLHTYTFLPTIQTLGVEPFDVAGARVSVSATA